MGKHNGKSRSTGLKVGAALANRAKKVHAARVGHCLDRQPCVRDVAWFELKLASKRTSNAAV